MPTIEVRKSGQVPVKSERVADVPDGWWRVDVFDSVADRARRHPLRVRVIVKTVDDGGDPRPTAIG